MHSFFFKRFDDCQTCTFYNMVLYGIIIIGSSIITMVSIVAYLSSDLARGGSRVTHSVVLVLPALRFKVFARTLILA